ncbi:MAG TPA: hypothetical protein VHF92_02270 [Geodermatophilus sp.]|nr:hypothetical protein [Geodermatophilus sp.]
MPLVILHLRWEDVSAEQYTRICAVLPPGTASADGCRSRQLRHVGTALLGIEVWTDDDAAARHMNGLARTVAPIGLAAPTTVAFCMPEVYARVYERDLARRAAAQAGSGQPGPLTADDVDLAAGGPA